MRINVPFLLLHMMYRPFRSTIHFRNCLLLCSKVLRYTVLATGNWKIATPTGYGQKEFSLYCLSFRGHVERAQWDWYNQKRSLKRLSCLSIEMFSHLPVRVTNSDCDSWRPDTLLRHNSVVQLCFAERRCLHTHEYIQLCYACHPSPYCFVYHYCLQLKKHSF